MLWTSYALLLASCLLGTTKASYSCQLMDKTKQTHSKSSSSRSWADLNNPYCDYPACNSYREWGCGLGHSCYDDSADSVCVADSYCAAYVPCKNDLGKDCVRACDDPPAGWQPKLPPAVPQNKTRSPVKMLKKILYGDKNCTQPLVFGDFQKANENQEWKAQSSCQVFLSLTYRKISPPPPAYSRRHRRHTCIIPCYLAP
jgi:hypothetical protein